VRFLQGTSIIEGSIYSTRATQIGGGLVKDKNYGFTLDSINSGVDGFNEGGDIHATYTNASLRYSQNIINTDIILKAPAGASLQSWIRRPQTWQERTWGTIGAADKNYYPTMQLSGGTILVDTGQNLAIEGTINSTVTNETYGVTEGKSLDNMHLTPKQIIVKTGASLTLYPSTSKNLTTTIYLDGGTLNIYEGANFEANIFCYNGGSVHIKDYSTPPTTTRAMASPATDGAFTFNGQPYSYTDANGDAQTGPGGIFIYGSAAIDPITGEPTGAGSSTNDFPNTLQVVGNDGLNTSTTTYKPVHYMGSTRADADKIAASLACNRHDAQTSACQHYGDFQAGTNTSGWIIGDYITQ
jgi:hypothetical protein